MKAVVLRGKRRGKIVKISQWCNDWFTIMESADIYSPTALAFSDKDMQTIMDHKNNGMLFRWFRTEFDPVIQLWVFKKKA